MFVLGDDSDEDAEEQGAETSESASSISPPTTKPLPAYQDVIDPANDSFSPFAPSSHISPPNQSDSKTRSVSAGRQRKYYINPCDTVHGIALRFGVDARELCRTNGLPISTLSTTPHLLHTRALLTLPPTSKPIPLQFVLSKEDQMKRDAQRARERAEKRLQMVTKEVDWQVAKTYVALVNGSEFEEDETAARKYKENLGSYVPNSINEFMGGSSSGLESKAIDMYLEDEEWEQQELGAGRSPRISQFPFPNKTSGSGTMAK